MNPLLPYLRGSLPAGAIFGQFVVGGSPAFVARMDARARQMASDAFENQGPNAFRSTRRAAAFHEVGHGVAAIADGRIVTKIEIFKNEDGWGGWCYDGRNPPIEPNSSPDDCIRAARGKIAGFISEELFLAGTDEFALGSSIDERIAFEVCIDNAARKLRCAPEQLSQTVIEDLRSLLISHGDSVLSLAEELYRQRKIIGRKLQRLLGSITLST